jgi:hypothetical protein
MMGLGKNAGGHHMSWFRFIAVFAVLGLCRLSGARSDDQPSQQPADDDNPRTVVYDVSDLIYRPGGRTGFDRIDEVARQIVTSVHAGGWGGEKEGASRLRELNGAKVEIHTTPKNHAEIVDLLGALRRLHDVDVNLRADLFEIDRALYEKEIKPKLNRRAAAEVAEGVVDLLRKKGALVVTHAVPVANGKASRPLSVRQAFTYIDSARPGPVPGGQTNVYGFGFQGLSVAVTPTISADRRTVSVKIAQKVIELIELKKRTLFAPNTDKEVTVEVPDLAENTATVTTDVDDGNWALAAVEYRAPAARGKDRVLVLALRPVIYIAEEDKALRGNNPK